ncbi:hypothetical protein HYQ44_014973 [Verticillium longisporum]|nr:hypothetical protein HYQ44_014973 [Verticillium longisporum]
MASRDNKAADAASRRERGVIAQREYRKRHANKVQILQDENTALRKAIEDIDTALRSRGLLVGDLSKVLNRARQAAGLPELQAYSELGILHEAGLSSSA